MEKAREKVPVECIRQLVLELLIHDLAIEKEVDKAAARKAMEKVIFNLNSRISTAYLFRTDYCYRIVASSV